MPPMLTGEERRELTLTTAAPTVRADDTGTQRFVGHAAVFDVRTAIGNPLRWGFYEQIAPGAFTKTLNEGDARFLLDHNSYYVVARSAAGTLELAQDKTGLRVDASLDTDLSYVSDLIANLRNGNVTGMSFGFHVVKDDWQTEQIETNDGQPAEVEVRTLQEVRLVEVSAVTFPAYEDTDAGLRHSLVPALRHRGDPDAIARAVSHRPELAELFPPDTREPAESTREDDTTDADESGLVTDDQPPLDDADPSPSGEGEPAASTPRFVELAKRRTTGAPLSMPYLRTA